MTKLLIILTALSSFLTTLETKTLSSDFTLTIAADATQPLNQTGAITLNGDRFRLSFLDIEAAYDGKTLYMYQADTDELTLSHPTEQELLETNPFLYAKALSTVCNITERQTSNDQTLITLTPKDQSVGIQRFILTLDKNQLPVRIEIKEGKKTTTLTLRNAKYLTTNDQRPTTNDQRPTTNYTLAPSAKTFVNDLR